MDKKEGLRKNSFVHLFDLAEKTEINLKEYRYKIGVIALEGNNSIK